jgi:hypothetical protein
MDEIRRQAHLHPTGETTHLLWRNAVVAGWCDTFIIIYTQAHSPAVVVAAAVSCCDSSDSVPDDGLRHIKVK